MFEGSAQLLGDVLHMIDCALVTVRESAEAFRRLYFTAIAQQGVSAGLVGSGHSPDDVATSAQAGQG